ncbi:hypothetical protein ASZ90_015457 [hydrocarbon metagenome]|uniref:Uncharacterized protein n=1 Tax=hydrocarbon metagenome TaxID=938273 RepID=A0A0W8F1Y8_9ZZZZ
MVGTNGHPWFSEIARSHREIARFDMLSSRYKVWRLMAGMPEWNA